LQFLGDPLGVFVRSWAHFTPYKEGNQKNRGGRHLETVLEREKFVFLQRREKKAKEREIKN
jgi:hypothetical protein